MIVICLACSGSSSSLPLPKALEGPAGAIHVVFTAVDCDLNAHDFRLIDSIASHSGYLLSGTMVMGLIAPGELPRVVRDYRIAFPVTPDSVGDYGRVLNRLGTSGPVVMILRKRSLVAMFVGLPAFEQFRLRSYANGIP